MRPIAVVTSCSAQGWEDYGRRFVETFAKHWPSDITLQVMCEDLHALKGPGIGVHGDRFTFRLLEHDFLARHAGNARAQGRVMVAGDTGWSEKKIAAGYNFRYDAFRFSKKVFAIEAVARQVKHGLLYWVDADVLTFADVPREFLEFLLPVDRALCCLERGEDYHSECGFVGYNMDHDLGPLFVQEFAKLYASDEVFKLREWHDSWVFDWLRRRMAIPVKPISHCSRKQPFINSKLGRYMDHLKGDSKKLGRSPTRHLVTNRDVPYWKSAA